MIAATDNGAASYDNEKSTSRDNSLADEKALSSSDIVGEKMMAKVAHGDIDVNVVGDVFDGPRLIDLDEEGKERPIDNAEDYALRLMSLEDDPSLRIFTFRMCFLSVGLSCFAAVLGQIFYFRPQTITVSALFLQIISYILGTVMEKCIPGPGEHCLIKTPSNKFTRFINGTPFSKSPLLFILSGLF